MNYHLFGTDGVRGQVGKPPMDEPALLKLGRVLAELFANGTALIGLDTRESGPLIQEWLARGIGRKLTLYSAGIIPTPGLAHLVRSFRFDLGIMISASHNPYGDNGIKLFGRLGEKLSFRQEKEIEHRFHRLRTCAAGTAAVLPWNNVSPYADFLLAQAAPIRGQQELLAIDAANGAAHALAPAIFQQLGFRTLEIGTTPNGKNINEECGSTHPEAIRRLVLSEKADLGMALDGDGDRVLFIDRQGRLLDGDHSLFALARYLQKTEQSFGNCVVGTEMSNLGLEHTLRKFAVRLFRAPVGDHYVLREMKKKGAILGGEPSGHTVLRHLSPSGDGLLTAICFIRALRHLGWQPEKLYKELRLLPQRLLNIPIHRRKPLPTWKELQALTGKLRRNHCRVLIRYSGTEEKLRIMIEGEETELIQNALEKTVALVQREIGVSHET